MTYTYLGVEMTKYIATASKTKVIFRKINKMNRAIALVNGHLYRIDDDLFCYDREGDDSFVLYDIDEQQPYGYGEYLNPDRTKNLIGSMELANNKPTKLFDMNIQLITIIIVFLFVGVSLVAQFLG